MDHSRRSGKLGTFDVTSMVVGSIIGADIYVATAIGSRLVGPASLLIWFAAGFMALVIAIAFSYCSMTYPRVGGPYAYVTEVSSPMVGFLVGWALLLAEWFSLCVFPVAFVQYSLALAPGIDPMGQVLLRAVFIIIIVASNIVGVQSAGRFNDALTVLKLIPLVLIVLGGIVFALTSPSAVGGNLQPFLTGGPQEIGQALVLIFWAYAGFELSTLPADDIAEPERTVPRAIITGMLIVIAFYLLTNLAVIASVDQSVLVGSPSPLLEATRSIFSPLGGAAGAVVLFVGLSALFSILGADESGTLGTSRLTYAMALDGLLPHSLAKKHDHFHTPYVAIMALGLTAFVSSLFGSLTTLINSSVFLLSLVYLATCLSAIVLVRQNPEKAGRLRGRYVIPLAGALFSLVLIALVRPESMVIGLSLLTLGIPVYAFFSPRKELSALRQAFYSRGSVAARGHQQSHRFLAFAVHALNRLLSRSSLKRGPPQ